MGIPRGSVDPDLGGDLLGQRQPLDEAFRVGRVGASEDAGPNLLELARPTVVGVYSAIPPCRCSALYQAGRNGRRGRSARHRRANCGASFTRRRGSSRQHPGWWRPTALPRDHRSARSSGLVDLHSHGGQLLLHQLAEGADLLVHNFRPATAGRLGLGTNRLPRRHPQLVVAVLGGFPGEGDASERPAYDLLAQAVSGVMAITGAPTGEPMKVGVALLDLIAGLETAVGALAALLARTQTADHNPAGSSGATVEVSLVEASVTSLINVLGNLLATGEEPRRYGNAHPNIVPYQAFAARDGHLAIAVGNDAQFGRLLAALGLEDPDGRYATNPRRLEHRDELLAWLSKVIAQRDRDGLVAALERNDVPAGPVNRVNEALAAMLAAHRGGWTARLDGIELAPSPIRVDTARLPARLPPPRLGEHTDEVLAEAGLSAEEIARLREEEAIA